MEIEIAALGDGRYEVIAQRGKEDPVTLSSEEALKDFLRARGISETQIANIVTELRPEPRKIRVVLSP